MWLSKYCMYLHKNLPEHTAFLKQDHDKKCTYSFSQNLGHEAELAQCPNPWDQLQVGSSLLRRGCLKAQLEKKQIHWDFRKWVIRCQSSKDIHLPDHWPFRITTNLYILSSSMQSHCRLTQTRNKEKTTAKSTRIMGFQSNKMSSILITTKKLTKK